MRSTPDAAETLAVLKDCLTTRFDIDAAHVQRTTPLRDLGLDSMMIMDVMLELEDRFGLKLTDLMLPREPTLGDVVALVQRNVGGTA